MNYSDSQLFEKYLYGGKFSLPFLLKFRCSGLSSVYLVNDNVNVIYENKTYIATSFEYSPGDMSGKGATLKISGIENDLVQFIELANENARLDVVGVISENGEVQALKQYKHFFGSVSYTEKNEITFTLTEDERFNMTFPPYKFDNETNKGNT